MNGSPVPGGFEILASEDSSLGLLCLRRRELLGRPGMVVTEITLDHELLMSSLHTASERALACRALEVHGGTDLEVLVGGLGLGYTAHAVLESGRARRVQVVELLPQVIGWLQQGLLPLAGALHGEPRLRIAQGDVFARLRAPPTEQYDGILLDVDHSPDELLHQDSRSFYSVEGLQEARRHLAPGGVLGVWSYAGNPAFARNLEAAFPVVRVEPVRFENELLDCEETHWLFLARA